MDERIYDQSHSYEDEERYKPREEPIWSRSTERRIVCGNCNATIRFLQLRCEKCKGLIDWD